MKEIFEHLVAGIWNRAANTKSQSPGTGVGLGRVFHDGNLTRLPLVWPHTKRCEHMAILGKTGVGKSSLMLHLIAQDVRQRRGFLLSDMHGQSANYTLRLIAAEERRTRTDLSGKLIIIDPADPEWSVGLNPLDGATGQNGFVQVAEISSILKQRWGLEHFGARTEELLRNALIVLADSHLTLIELAPLLIDPLFRARCLGRVQNAEVRQYFELRYDTASEGMQAVVRDPVLNKLTAFTADPAFRHIIGQRGSTFSLRAALDDGCWIILDLNKGRLGEQVATLGALFLTRIKNALFGRRRRDIYTIYADELQNLVAIDTGIDTLVAEARKFGISVVSANQYFDQYPAQMRATILSLASHVMFQLSNSDAEKMGSALDGGKSLAELLRNLPPRNFVAKIGHNRWQRGYTADVPEIQIDATDLHNRSRARWSRRRTDIEADIQSRRADCQPTPRQEGGLDGWE